MENSSNISKTNSFAWEEKFTTFPITNNINSFINQTSYESTAELYAKNAENSVPKNEINEFMSSLPANATILDLGCGSGRDAKIFSENGFQVTGIDFSNKMIEISKKTAQQAKFFLMNIECLYFRNESFDGIWAICSLLHISKKNLPNVLSKIHDLLKPNGLFCLSVKQGNDEGYKIDERYGGVIKFFSYFQVQEISTFVSNAKFTVLKTTTVVNSGGGYFNHPIIHLTALKTIQNSKL